MEFREFELMLRDEKSHWWYKARRRVVTGYLNRYCSNNSQASILDIASACGANFVDYEKYGKIYGIDISEESIKFCKYKGINMIVRGDAHKLPFANRTFDIVVALDALEHFEDDLKVLGEIQRVIKNKGIFIITVPAMDLLWSQHDTAFHHLRRYSLRELSNKLNSSGFVIEYITCRLFFVFLPVLIFRKLRNLLYSSHMKINSKSDFHTVLPWVFSILLDYILRLEEYMIGREWEFPIGVSIFCVAKSRT